MKCLFFVFFLSFSLYAKATVCLNMIVKDEADVIETCLKSVLPLIDTWIIVDTGSSDQTKEQIQKTLQGVPGELHSRPWVDFAHNRNEALQLTKGKADYLLFIDADEILQFDSDYTFPPLTLDRYDIRVRQLNAGDIHRTLLVKNTITWRWEGILHEYITASEERTRGFLPELLNICNASIGARSKNPNKTLDDAKTLAKALEKEANPRYAFFAGLSFLASKEYPSAIKYFEQRLSMNSSDAQETYNTAYHLGISYHKYDQKEKALPLFFLAHQLRPYRAEPLFKAAICYREQQNYLLGYLLTQYALKLPYPSQDNCVDYTAYDYGILIEFAQCATLSGHLEEGLNAWEKLLETPNLPKDLRERVSLNCLKTKELIKNAIKQKIK